MKKERKRKNLETILEERKQYYKENKEYILNRQRKYFKDWYKENRLDILGARRNNISVKEYRNNKQEDLKKQVEIKERKIKKDKKNLGTTPIDLTCNFD